MGYKVGDRIYVYNKRTDMTKGKAYVITRISGPIISFNDDIGDQRWVSIRCVKKASQLRRP